MTPLVSFVSIHLDAVALVGSGGFLSLLGLSSYLGFRLAVLERRTYQIETCATRDAITSLLSGVYFRRVAFPSAVKAHAALALLYLDVDGLKRLNDAQGHSAGDQLLVTCAGVLADVCGKSGTPFRLHGDEFTVLLPDCDSERAKRHAYRILVALRRRQITASIGAAATDRVPASTLFDEAEAAMRRAKAAGKARTALASGGASQRESERATNTTVRTTLRSRVPSSGGPGRNAVGFAGDEVRS